MRQRLSLVLLLVSIVLALALVGCGATVTAGDTTTTTQGGSNSAAARAADEAVSALRRVLAGLVGVETGDLKATDAIPTSPLADEVIEWTGGKAEIDSGTAIVYSVTTDRLVVGANTESLTVERLENEALNIASALGWTDGTLRGLGFKQELAPTIDTNGTFTIVWNQYDSKGAREDGSVVLTLDGSNASLIGFSAWVGNDVADVAGAITEAQAMQIAQTQIYLQTDDPKLSLAGDGSIILLNRKVTEQLVVVSDPQIVKNSPRLCWVITLLGTARTKTVGATVHIEAATGKVLKYEAYKSPEPVTTTVATGS